MIFNGTSLTPQGSAGIYVYALSNITVSSSIYWSQLSQANLAALSYSSAAVSQASIPPLSVVAVHTNGGNYSKLFILESSSGTTAATGSVTTDTAAAIFYRFPSSALSAGSSVNLPSVGSCVILGTPGEGGVSPTGLDAGTINLSGAGAQTTLPPIQGSPGYYGGKIASIPSTGGTYTFTGSGGKDVGAFSATINFPNPLVWTNQPSPTFTINRAQGYTVTWSGGAPGTYVEIGGQSTVSTNAQGTWFVSATFSALRPWTPASLQSHPGSCWRCRQIFKVACTWRM